MEDNRIKYFEMIQGVINRMASNSFMLKGWAVTLVSGIFILASKDADKTYFLVAYIPVIVFWGLDAYYLQQERLYRSLYNDVRNMKADDIAFAMKATYNDYQDEKNKWVNCVVSKTEIWFYLPLALVCTGIIIITHLS